MIPDAGITGTTGTSGGTAGEPGRWGLGIGTANLSQPERGRQCPVRWTACG